MRVYVRYDTPLNEDDEKSTRRVKYGQMGENVEGIEKPPELQIPDEGLYLWDWFLDLNSSVTRIRDGQCSLIAPQDIAAWSHLTETLINSHEYKILRAMDLEFCNETNKEMAARRNKQIDDADKGKGRR